MDSSRRAVESYWRSRMIDGATSDEDKVTPLYKLEEICELLRSSHSSIVKEVSEFILKRLDHKSPIVKQKALRVVKYAVGKSGVEFRREMQRNSVAVRQLIHYKGQLDPLKGDALNKAVRATAQEVLSAIFSTDDNNKKAAAAPSENLTKRIQGFGNANYEMPSSEDKKSFLSEVVGIGSATIKQGLNNLTQSPSLKKNDTGSYRSPNLRRSLTTEIDQSDRYEGFENHSETQLPSRFSNNSTGGTWARNFETAQTESSNGNSSSGHSINNNNNSNSREERLLETIVTSGGVRLQPTRDALHAFLMEVPKLDALALSHALELKLQSHLWQVRVKAVCVLEAILRKKDDGNLAIIASYFGENKDVVVKCYESPQASLREKANKVLSLLDPRDATGGRVSGDGEKPVKAETITVAQLPNLIDTGDSDELYYDGGGNKSTNQMPTSSPLIDDLFGGGGEHSSEQKNDDDPFADVSFHINNDKPQHSSSVAAEDPFTGLTTDKPVGTGGAASAEFPSAANKNGPQLIDDIFGSTSEPPHPPPQKHKGFSDSNDINDLMGGMSINRTNDSSVKQNTTPLPPGGLFSDSTANPTSHHQTSNDVFNGMQAAGFNNANPMFPTAYNLPSGIMFNPAFPSQPINYGAMGYLLPQQQQFLATMSNFQQLGNLQSQNTASIPYSTTGGIQAAAAGGYASSVLPDIFNPTIPTQAPTSMMNSSKKEDTRAFDFISDHLAAARDPKRVI